MSTTDWSQCSAVESIPGKVSGAWVFGAWVFKGIHTRLPVATVIENLEDLSVDEVMEQFDVTREQINGVLDFVAQSLKNPLPERQPAPVDAHPVCPRNTARAHPDAFRAHRHDSPIQRLGQVEQRRFAERGGGIWD